MRSDAHWTQQYKWQLHHDQPTVASNWTAERSWNHYHQRPQSAAANREKLQNLQRSTLIHCPQFQVHWEMILPLCKSLVRPHLELWSPHLQRGIIKIEKVQRKASKIIPEIRNHSSSQRLKDLKLTSREQRRLRGRLIVAFKYLRRFNKATARGHFDRDFNDRTRINGEELIVKRFDTCNRSTFLPHQDNKHLDCPREWHSKQQIQWRHLRTASADTWNWIPQLCKRSSYYDVHYQMQHTKKKDYFIIKIKKGQQCKAVREWYTPYQSEDPSPTIPTYRPKEEKGKESYSRDRAA